MDLSVFDKYFTVDKNKINLIGSLVSSDLVFFLITSLNIKNSRDFRRKVSHWLDYDRHESENIEEEFFKLFNIKYETLPDNLKDLNLNKELIPPYRDVFGIDIRYTNYMRNRWHELRNVLLDGIKIIDHEDFTSTVEGIGLVNEIPFIVGFALTCEGNYIQKSKSLMQNSYLKFNKNQKHSLMKTFLVSSFSNIKSSSFLQNWNDNNWDVTDRELKIRTHKFFLLVDDIASNLECQKVA